MDIFFFMVKNRGGIDKYPKKDLLFVKDSLHLNMQNVAYIKG